jgi:hypothetical protein
MEKVVSALVMYICDEIGGNSIGPKGGLQLSKSKWKYLERLELCRD